MKIVGYLAVVLLSIIAVFIVLTKKLHMAAILFGTFSAISSLVFVLLAAPDVALAQTIIGCTVSTIIFVAGIRKYHVHPCLEPRKESIKRRMRNSAGAILMMAILGMVFYYGEETISIRTQTMSHIMQHYLETGAENAVTAVYLDFRILDTLLEAFLLLVSVIGISQFIILEDIEKMHKDPVAMGQVTHSNLTAHMGRILLMVVGLFGGYTILFGADSPGGGFQGGAILSAIVMIWYLTKGESSFHLHKLCFIEEIAFLLFVALVGSYFLFYSQLASYRHLYLLLCAILVGIKVAIGLSVIFLHFAGGDDEID